MNYEFKNLLGTVYRKGNLRFTEDGGKLYSPVGNKISVYDLERGGSRTLNLELRHDVEILAPDPRRGSKTMLVASSNGDIHIVSTEKGRILHKEHTNRRIYDAAFSPDGKYLVLAKEESCLVLESESFKEPRYGPLVIHRVLKGACSSVRCLAWSSDSNYIIAGADCTRIYSMKDDDNKVFCLGSGNNPVHVAFHEDFVLSCHTLAPNGELSQWECDEKGSNFSRTTRHFTKDFIKEMSRNVDVTAGDYHPKTEILVAGFSNGTFLVLQMPDVQLIHSLSMENEISAIALNSTGEWIALGSAASGGLLVWEWKSETYVLKQKGHYNNLECLAYSPDGLLVATGGSDGKVKLWNTDSGFCFVTFSEHTSPITGVAFTSNNKVILSSSLDGTVRAFDLSRYRNFRTFTSPKPVQFGCLSVDSSGELVAAGGKDVYDIYLWSLKTGRLLEVISGHEGPVDTLAFSPSLTSSGTFVSASWDKTMRIWNSIDVSSGASEVIQLGSDGIAVAFRPDGNEVAVASLNGQISIFTTGDGTQVGTIEGRNDLGSGRADSDLITAKKSKESKCFTSISYSADGKFIIAGGSSKNICIYHVKEMLLVKKFEITRNHSLDAVDDVISRKTMSEWGNLALIQDRNDGDEIPLPGARKDDKSTRSLRPEIHVSGTGVSPTGREFSVTCTEGLLVYSLDVDTIFDPTDLVIEITPSYVINTLNSGDETSALFAALKLNETNLIRRVIETIPVSNVEHILQLFPDKYFPQLIRYLARELETSKHLEFYSLWVNRVLKLRGGIPMKKNAKELYPELNYLQKNLILKTKELGQLCDNNSYTASFLVTMAKLKKMKTDAIREKEEKETEEVSMSEDEIMEIEDMDFKSNWQETK